MHIIHLPKCSTWTQNAKMPKFTTPACPHAKCRSGSSKHRELMAVSGAPNTCSGSFRGHRGVKCRAPYCWLSHLHQPARSPCPPCIDLILQRDKAVIGWGLGIRWPCLAWLIPLFLGRLGSGPRGQAKVNPIQSPVLCGPVLPCDLSPLPKHIWCDSRSEPIV